MSNRSLMEFNHDFVHQIAEGDGAFFVQALRVYLNSASPENAERLERFGVRVFGMRHHSSHFDIDWGGLKASEPDTTTPRG